MPTPPPHVEPSGIWRESRLAIAGTGHYLPRHKQIAELDGRRRYGQVDEPHVLGRVSAQQRHVADDDETAHYMAVRAACQALTQASVRATDVDLLVLANWTDRLLIPELAPRVAAELGATRALAFDVCAACAGFVHAVQTAAAYLTSPGPWHTALVVCTEQFSRRVRPGSRSEAVLGDAAGAVVLAARSAGGSRILDSALTSDGARWEVCTAPVPAGWLRVQADLPDHALAGQVEMARLLLDHNGLKIADVDWVIPHPGTDAIHTSVREALGIKPAQFLTNFPRCGNTASASIPIALSEYQQAGTVRRGDLVLSTAVGAGWYYGGLLFHF